MDVNVDMNSSMKPTNQIYYPEHKKNGKKTTRYPDTAKAWIILGPMIIWWIVVYGFPVIFGFFLGFLDWNNMSAAPRFAGIKNYIRFFTDKDYYMTLIRSIWIGSLATFTTILGGFGVAMLMNLPLVGKKVYRTFWYVPAVTSVAATTQILIIFLDPTFGILNRTLEKLFNIEPIVWQYSVFWGVFWIVAYTIWRGIGATALLWLAGLQSIDQILYEAASIDGAGRIKKLLHVTLPGIKPVSTYIIVTGVIGAIQIYEPVFFITKGGPVGGTEVIITRLLKDAFYDYNLGMAGASQAVMAVTVLVFTIIYFRFIIKSDS